MMKWQPIETAPKDGTLVLLWRADAERMEVLFGTPATIGRFVVEKVYDIAAAAEFAFDGRWVEYLGGVDRSIHAVTHWMPIPAPPEP